jgi:hypothetical protein
VKFAPKRSCRVTERIIFLVGKPEVINHLRRQEGVDGRTDLAEDTVQCWAFVKTDESSGFLK